MGGNIAYSAKAELNYGTMSLFVLIIWQVYIRALKFALHLVRIHP